MREAYTYYWFHLVPQAVIDQFGFALIPEHLQGLPRVAMDQACYFFFALPYLMEVAPMQGDWKDVPMGQDVLLDAGAACAFRRACETMTARMKSVTTAARVSAPSRRSNRSAVQEPRAFDIGPHRREMLAVLRTLANFSARLREANLYLLVAHWPYQEIP